MKMGVPVKSGGGRRLVLESVTFVKRQIQQKMKGGCNYGYYA